MSKSKKSLVLVLCLPFVILSLTGCGSIAMKKGDIIGTYKNIGILMEEDVTYNIHDNETYDQICDVPALNFKGTYKFGGGKIQFYSKNGQLIENIVQHGDYFFVEGLGEDGFSNMNHAYFEKDDEYGKTLSLDSNGRTDQKFKSSYFPTYSAGEGKRWVFSVTIQFNKDGTFELETDKGVNTYTMKYYDPKKCPPERMQIKQRY